MTCSGRCFAPVNSGAKKEKEFIEEGGIKITVPREKDKKMINELVTEVKVNEFLKFIKHSEYSIVE